MSAARQPANEADERIDLRSGPSVDHWTQTLGVSREELAAVVGIVGERPSDVADYLKQHGPPATTD
jgi:hypothetical protein